MSTIKEMLAIRNNNDNMIPSVIRAYDYGHDMSGEFAHINVSIGMVDINKVKVKFYTADENGVFSGYQRVSRVNRVRKIAQDFSKSRLQPITVAVIDGSLYAIDGQTRVNAARAVRKNNNIDTPYIPALILDNATEEDCAKLFAIQDDNSTLVPQNLKIRTKVIGKDKFIIDFLERLNANGINIYNPEKNSISSKFAAVKTYQNIYLKFLNNGDMKVFDRICRTISRAYKVIDEDGNITYTDGALKMEMIKGLTAFYKCYGDKINDDIMVKNLNHYIPESIFTKINRNTPSKSEPNTDKSFKYIKTFIDVYNDKYGNKSSKTRLRYV